MAPLKIYHLRNGKKCFTEVGSEEKVWKQPCKHQGQRRRRVRRCFRHWSRGSPTAHGEERGEAGCLPAVHGGQYQSRYPHRSQSEQVVMLWRKVQPIKSPSWSRFILNSCSTQWTGGGVLSWRTAAHGEGSQWSRGEVWSRKKQQVRIVTSWPQPPFPVSRWPLGGGGFGEVGNEGVKLSLGREARRKAFYFFSLFLTIQTYFNWQEIKLILPEPELVCLQW